MRFLVSWYMKMKSTRIASRFFPAPLVFEAGEKVLIKTLTSWGPCLIIKKDESYYTVRRINTTAITTYRCYGTYLVKYKECENDKITKGPFLVKGKTIY